MTIFHFFSLDDYIIHGIHGSTCDTYANTEGKDREYIYVVRLSDAWELSKLMKESELMNTFIFFLIFWVSQSHARLTLISM